MRYDFETTGPITVAAKMRSSDLVVTASESSQVVVEVEPRRGGDDVAAATRVELAGDRLVIEVPKTIGTLFRSSGSVLVSVQVPAGTSLDVDSGSGDVRAQGTYAAAEIRAGSGDVTLDRAEPSRITSGSGDVSVAEAAILKVTSGSGDVRVGRGSRLTEVRSGSGDIAIEDAADVSFVTGSGDAIIGSFDGTVTMSTGSGDLLVRRAEQGEVQARTASGDVIVGVAAGTAAMLDCSSISGRVSSDLTSGDAPSDDERGVVLRLRSVSGDVRVQRA